jgi:hypothetical protein
METTELKLPAKRTLFLTILCLFSLIGSCLFFIVSTWSYFHYSAIASQLASGGMKNDDQVIGMKMFSLDYHSLAISSLVLIMLNFPVLWGVVLMWKQKKSGFFLYGIFELLQALAPALIVGGLDGLISSAFYLLVAIICIILYSLNLKHLH